MEVPGSLATVKTVRVRKGQLVVTDGPFAETKEWIGGFDLLDCENIDEAIEIVEASNGPLRENRGQTIVDHRLSDALCREEGGRSRG